MSDEPHWLIVNPDWPSGEGPYRERCSGCEECEPNPTEEAERSGAVQRRVETMRFRSQDCDFRAAIGSWWQTELTWLLQHVRDLEAENARLRAEIGQLESGYPAKGMAVWSNDLDVLRWKLAEALFDVHGPEAGVNSSEFYAAHLEAEDGLLCRGESVKDSIQKAVRWLVMISRDVRSAGDLPLVELSSDGATMSALTLADELYLIAVTLDGNYALAFANEQEQA